MFTYVKPLLHPPEFQLMIHVSFTQILFPRRLILFSQSIKSSSLYSSYLFITSVRLTVNSVYTCCSVDATLVFKTAQYFYIFNHWLTENRYLCSLDTGELLALFLVWRWSQTTLVACLYHSRENSLTKKVSLVAFSAELFKAEIQASCVE